MDKKPAEEFKISVLPIITFMRAFNNNFEVWIILSMFRQNSAISIPLKEK